jgi:phage shock protein PspC (stress-responsive transcriptional regulator)
MVMEDIETQAQVQYRRDPLYRPVHDRMVAGVASGIARYLNVDVTLVRIGFVVTLIFGGLGVALYAAGLLLIPEEGTDQSLAGSLVDSLQNRTR